MTTRRIFDVDIDVSPKTDKDKYGTRAMAYNHEMVSAHPSGYYLETVPVDPITGLCSFDSSYGDSAGFQKVDLLSNSSYDMFESKEEVLKYAEMEPEWDLLLEEDVVQSLPHLAKHIDLLTRIQPRSIHDLADTLALIRPGKSHLIDSYMKNKERVRKKLYKRSKDHYFKKSHAYSYAMMIICVLNKISESRIVF